MVYVEINHARESDAFPLAVAMRAEDRAEVEASSGKLAYDVSVDAIRGSVEAWTVRFDGQVAAVFGVNEGGTDFLFGRTGWAWLLTTGLVERHAKTFWRLCKQILPTLFDRWDELANAIDVRHTKAIRWAERLGMRLEEPAPFGAAGLDFRVFHVRKEDLRYV